MKFCFDSSSLLDLWNDHYPKDTFPALYRKLEKVRSKIVIIKPIFDEISDEEELCAWLNNNNIRATTINKTHENQSLSLENRYEINPNLKKGASKADIKLIAYAKIEKLTVVSSEAKQPNKPKEFSKYKIPLICKFESVPCINLLQFFKEHNIKI